MHLRAVVNPSCDFNWLVGPVHLVKNIVQDIPCVGNRSDTTSNDAEVGNLNPGTNELALFEGSRAAMAKQGEPKQHGRKRSVKPHTKQVTEPDGIVKGSNVPKQRQAVETFQIPNFNFEGSQDGSPEA